MEKTYQPKAIEQALYQCWEQQGYFKAGGAGMPYSIVLPPPNVTGSLHMGHGFQDVIMDCLTRYHRMQGDNTLWQPGTDHAGIATQMVVERQLADEGKTRYDLGREKFIEKTWQWKEQSGGTIGKQMRRLGASCDWSREKFSMDPDVSKATYEAFIRLYEDGLIYRGERLVNWDPELKTAISDLEVISTDSTGSLWHFRYPLSDGSGHLVIATTRPETMLGDTAVAVHPDDERYQALIGKTITLPLANREIPIIADEYVDPEFGTGCVKITPAHDFNDYDMGKRHDLPMINILTDEAKLNGNVPEAYQGLERFAARKQIVADMEAQGLLEKIEPHQLKIPRNERGNAVIEPYLSPQWYVKVDSLAKPAIEAVEQGRVTFFPDNYKNLYYSWMRDIQDWCISRQLWWGHRIPAWYDDEGNVYVGMDETEVRHKHGLAESVTLQQDNDVFDTWFTAALWPMSSLGWPEKTPELSTYYPTSVLVTGFDIIFFWVARMIMFGLKFMGDVPFKSVYMHGLIRDQDGQKMSKSKGNVLDPIDLIDGIDAESLIAKRTAGLMQASHKDKVIKATKKHFPEGIGAYGTDALRFTYCALASTSRDICFDIKRMEGYRNFCNKLWNAARFVLMQVEGHELTAPQGELSLTNAWIQDRLNHCITAMHQHIHGYRFDLMAQSIYEFVWNDYCDWYLEFSKALLASDYYAEAEKAQTRYMLVAVLSQILHLAHPIIPFITESIWHTVQPLTDSQAPSLMQAPYPQAASEHDAPQAVSDMAFLQSMVSSIRQVRSEMGVAPSKHVPVLVQFANETQQTLLQQHHALLQGTARLSSLECVADNAELPATASGLVGKVACHIPVAGLIDVAAEQARLDKELEKLAKEQQRLHNKLGNERFVANAPEAVVAKERAKLAELEEQHAQIVNQQARLQQLG